MLDLKTLLCEEQAEVNRKLVKGKAGSSGLQGGEVWGPGVAFSWSQMTAVENAPPTALKGTRTWELIPAWPLLCNVR